MHRNSAPYWLGARPGVGHRPTRPLLLSSRILPHRWSTLLGKGTIPANWYRRYSIKYNWWPGNQRQRQVSQVLQLSVSNIQQVAFCPGQDLCACYGQKMRYRTFSEWESRTSVPDKVIPYIKCSCTGMVLAVHRSDHGCLLIRLLSERCQSPWLPTFLPAVVPRKYSANRWIPELHKSRKHSV